QGISASGQLGPEGQPLLLCAAGRPPRLGDLAERPEPARTEVGRREGDEQQGLREDPRRGGAAVVRETGTVHRGSSSAFSPPATVSCARSHSGGSLSKSSETEPSTRRPFAAPG